MNLKIGQVFNKNGQDYCLIDIINYNSNNYYLFYIDGPAKNFEFYEFIYKEGKNNKFLRVNDDNLIGKLFELYEEKGVSTNES